MASRVQLFPQRPPAPKFLNLWEMDSIRALREALSLFTASGAHYATVGPSERLGVCSRSFPLLARALEDKHNPPLGCEDCQWRAADLDATGDCMIAACAWQLRKLIDA